MSISDDLPKFHNPPLVEAALGVMFAGPGMPLTMHGQFYQLVRHEFPTQSVQPAVSPGIEMFVSDYEAQSQESASIVSPLMVGDLDSGLRSVFTAADGHSCVQIQRDRLVLNWLGGHSGGTYPSYSRLRERFAEMLTTLGQLTEAESLGPLNPIQCETSYLNVMNEADTKIPTSEPWRMFPAWSNTPASIGSSTLEDVSTTIRYRLVDEAHGQFGRLHFKIGSITPPGHSLFRVDIVGRGFPRGQGLDGVLAFHDHAHDQIVRSFTAMTSDEMHKLWGRYQ